MENTTKIATILSNLKFNLNPIRTPFSMEKIISPSTSLLILMSDHLDKGGICLISKNGLIGVYQKALGGGNIDKFPAYRNKIKRLNSQ